MHSNCNIAKYFIILIHCSFYPEIVCSFFENSTSKKGGRVSSLMYYIGENKNREIVWEDFLNHQTFLVR
tara:strand:- start:67 stop:273 length:207 start_codon:yes stop_codon:yes gene_type:complete